MKKIRVFAVLLLCVALLAFAGCGEKKSDQDTENGTVTEETLNHDEETKGTDDGSAMDEMKDGAEKAVDDMKDAVDGDKTENRTNKNEQIKGGIAAFSAVQ